VASSQTNGHVLAWSEEAGIEWHYIIYYTGQANAVQLGPTDRRRQAPLDQRGQGLAGAHGCLYSLAHGVPPWLAPAATGEGGSVISQQGSTPANFPATL
jgi:hypothetical protein